MNQSLIPGAMVTLSREGSALSSGDKELGWGWIQKRVGDGKRWSPRQAAPPTPTSLR